ncbi:hypothetical protein C0J45_12279 [Silurus meridionalis]|nr:hypothetical protein C0J45_12279 [Silurus meridionalis]
MNSSSGLSEQQLMYWRLQVRLRRYERGSVSRAEKIWSSASIVYAWRRRNFREAVLGDRTPLLLYTHQAFFEQSLRNDAEETGSGQN